MSIGCKTQMHMSGPDLVSENADSHRNPVISCKRRTATVQEMTFVLFFAGHRHRRIPDMDNLLAKQRGG